MGTVMAIMGVYYLLNGQIFRAAKEVADWLNENPPHSEDKNEK